MELSSTVCTLQQAKRLRDLGITQTSFHQWIKGCPAVLVEDGEHWMISRVACFAPAPDEWGLTYSAFTATELGSLLPEWIDKDLRRFEQWAIANPDKCDIKEKHAAQYRKNPGEYDSKDFPDAPIFSRTEAEVRAAMLILLLERHKATPAECNSRLLNS